MKALVAYGSFLVMLLMLSIQFSFGSCRSLEGEKERKHENQLDHDGLLVYQKRGDVPATKDRHYRQRIVQILDFLSHGYNALLNRTRNSRKKYFAMDEVESCNVYQALVDLSNKYSTRLESERSAIKSDKKMAIHLGAVRNNMDRVRKILEPLLTSCRQRNPILRELMNRTPKPREMSEFMLFPLRLK